MDWAALLLAAALPEACCFGAGAVAGVEGVAAEVAAEVELAVVVVALEAAAAGGEAAVGAADGAATAAAEGSSSSSSSRQRRSSPSPVTSVRGASRIEHGLRSIGLWYGAAWKRYMSEPSSVWSSQRPRNLLAGVFGAVSSTSIR